MRQIKIFFTILVLLSTALFPNLVSAQTPATINCSDLGECKIQETDSRFFYDDNIAPGELRDKELLIRNENENWACAIRLGIETNQEQTSILSTGLAQYLIFRVDRKRTFYSRDMLQSGIPPIIGYIDPRSTKQFLLQAGIDPLVGNELQNTQVKFDLALTFLCDDPALVIPPAEEDSNGLTPPPSATPQPANIPKVECSDTAQAPVLDLVSLSSTEATFRWITVGAPQQVLITTKSSDGLVYRSDVTSKQEYTLRGLDTLRYEVFLEALYRCGTTTSNTLVLNEDSKASDLLPATQSTLTTSLGSSSSSNPATPTVLGASIDTEGGTTDITRAVPLFRKTLNCALLSLLLLGILKILSKKWRRVLFRLIK